MGGITLKLYKRLIIGITITISLIVITLFAVVKVGKQETNLPVNFGELVKKENISLTIYYLSPNVRTRYGVSLKSLMNKMYQYKITTSHSGIFEYAALTEYKYYDLLNKINDMELLPGKSDSITNCRVHYFFKDDKGRKLLSVTLWGKNGNIIVNGHNVKENKIFYDIIIPFLPKNAADILQDYIPSK